MPKIIKQTVKLASLAITFALLSSCTSAQSPPFDFSGSNMTTDTTSRGRQLRVAIDKAYADLKVSNTPRSKESNDFSNAVTIYIPPGTKFADAVEILNAAGFDEGQKMDGYVNINKTLVKAFVYFAKINRYDGALFSNTTFSVTITPDDYATWASVKTISAGWSRVDL